MSNKKNQPQIPPAAQLNLGTIFPVFSVYRKKIDMVQAITEPFLDGDMKCLAVKFQNCGGFIFFSFFNTATGFWEWDFGSSEIMTKRIRGW